MSKRHDNLSKYAKKYGHIPYKFAVNPNANVACRRNIILEIYAALQCYTLQQIKALTWEIQDHKLTDVYNWLIRNEKKNGFAEFCELIVYKGRLNKCKHVRIFLYHYSNLWRLYKSKYWLNYHMWFWFVQKLLCIYTKSFYGTSQDICTQFTFCRVLPGFGIGRLFPIFQHCFLGTGTIV